MISTVLGLPFRAASSLRHARVFHPDGILFTAEVTRTAPDGHGLPMRSCTATARLSKGIGVPTGLPDVAGLAFRMPAEADGDPPWDVLLASAGPGALGRMIPWPANSWNSAEMTTLMPLRYDGRLWWLRARITSPNIARLDLASARSSLAEEGITVSVEQSLGTAGFEPLARLRSNELMPTGDERYGFDPIIHSHPQVRPQPEWLRDLRASAYRHSRAGRPSWDVPAH